MKVLEFPKDKTRVPLTTKELWNIVTEISNIKTEILNRALATAQVDKTLYKRYHELISILVRNKALLDV